MTHCVKVGERIVSTGHSHVDFVFDGGRFRVEFEEGQLRITLDGDILEPMIIMPDQANVVLIGMKERES